LNTFHLQLDDDDTLNVWVVDGMCRQTIPFTSVLRTDDANELFVRFLSRTDDTLLLKSVTLRLVSCIQ